MTLEQSELARAELNSHRARARLTATLIELQGRINPRTLARDAVDELRETAVELAASAVVAARRNPGPLLSIGAILLALLSRKKIVGAFAGKPDAEDPDDRSAPEIKAAAKASLTDAGIADATAMPPPSLVDDQFHSPASPHEGSAND